MNPEAERQIPLLPVHNSSETRVDTPIVMQYRPKTFKLTDLTVNIPSSNRQSLNRSSGDQQSLSRWWTVEFKIYYAIALVVIPIMIWIPISLSSRMFQRTFLQCLIGINKYLQRYIQIFRFIGTDLKMGGYQVV